MNIYEDRAKALATLFPESITISNYLVEDDFLDKALQYKPDFLLHYHGKPFCPIEMKVTPASNNFTILYMRASLIEYARQHCYPYALIDLNDSCYLLSESDGYSLHEPITLQEAASVIIPRMTAITTTEVVSLAKAFLEKLKLIARSTPELREEIVETIERMDINDLDWSHISNSPTIITLSPEFEHKLFMAVLGGYTHHQVCRYTYRNSLKRIIDNKKQSLCSIVGMNDKSECYYTDDYLALRRGTPNTTPHLSASLNKYYITSCSRMDNNPEEGDMNDNLTMWRMYADEGKGVCMVLDIDSELMKQGYTLAPVSYGKVKPVKELDYDDDDGTRYYTIEGMDHYHPELDFIFAIQFCKVGGYEYRFPNFDFWKHFFKAFEYRDEKEIRLMYKAQEGDKNKWIEGNDIFCPVVEKSIKTDSNEFPLILKKVILGPKFTEKEVNVIQLRQMISESDILNADNIECTLSAIDNYR